MHFETLFGFAGHHLDGDAETPLLKRGDTASPVPAKGSQSMIYLTMGSLRAWLGEPERTSATNADRGSIVLDGFVCTSVTIRRAQPSPRKNAESPTAAPRTAEVPLELL